MQKKKHICINRTGAHLTTWSSVRAWDARNPAVASITWKKEQHGGDGDGEVAVGEGKKRWEVWKTASLQIWVTVDIFGE